MQLNTPSAPAAASRTEPGSVTSPCASRLPGEQIARLVDIANEGDHLVAALDQAARHRVPDLSGRAGTKKPHRPSINRARCASTSRGVADAVPKLAPTMGRFRDLPDLFLRLNSSLEFDCRLRPARHRGIARVARALRSAGVLDDAELERLLEGLDAVERELEQGTFASSRTTRTSTW